MRSSVRKWSVFISTAVTVAFFAASTAGARVIVADAVRSTLGVVAAGRPAAAEAGAEILSRGGNAVDAAVATAFALAVVEPYASNLGGEGVLLLSLTDGTEIAIDYRSRAPLHVDALTPDNFGHPRFGPQSTMLPGMVKGMEWALSRYGTMSFADVLAPAIRLAEVGYIVDDQLAAAIADGYDDLVLSEQAAALWLVDGGVPPPGTTLRNPDLARTMRLLAEHGADVFYRGEIARAMEEATAGWLDRISLAAYTAYERSPVRGTYRGYEILGAPPMVAGIRVQQTLSILENFDLKQYDRVDDPRVIHLLAEAFKLSRADFDGHIWDPYVYPVPFEGLLSVQYAEARARLIDPERAQSFEPGDPALFAPDGSASIDPATAAAASASASAAETGFLATTQFSVLDNDGNAVAASHTLNSLWGSRVVVPGYGFILGNHFHRFSPLDPNEPRRRDYAAPLKSTKTDLSPTIVKENGKVKFILGAADGRRIPATIVHMLVGILDFEMDLASVLRIPKFYANNELLLDMEGDIPEETVARLGQLGHRVHVGPLKQRYVGTPNVVSVEADGTMLARGALDRPGAAAAPATLPPPPLRQPVLITPAGQSSGALMVHVLANRAGLDNTYSELASVQQLDGAQSLIIVVGASMKGLGAAGMSLAQELGRIESLLERARRDRIGVVAVHIEGNPRRDAAGDELAELAFRHASRAVVRDDGDRDGFFTELASAHEVELIRVPAATDVGAVLVELFKR